MELREERERNKKGVQEAKEKARKRVHPGSLSYRFLLYKSESRGFSVTGARILKAMAAPNSTLS